MDNANLQYLKVRELKVGNPQSNVQVSIDNVFHFFEDNKAKNEIETISYQFDVDGKILGIWEKKDLSNNLWVQLSFLRSSKQKLFLKKILKNIV